MPPPPSALPRMLSSGELTLTLLRPDAMGIPWGRSCRGGSVVNGARKCLGLRDPARDFGLARDAAHELLALVDGREHASEVAAVALGEFGDAIDPGCFEQVGVLAADAVDAAQISVVDPLQQQPLADPGLLRQRLAAAAVPPCSSRCSAVVSPCPSSVAACFGPMPSMSSSFIAEPPVRG